MIYKETSKSIDLFLYATSDDDLYRRMITPIIENLRKKAIKGAYDKEKAVDAYYYIATEASKNYNKDFGHSFSASDRFSAAVDMEEYQKRNLKIGMYSAFQKTACSNPEDQKDKISEI